MEMCWPAKITRDDDAKQPSLVDDFQQVWIGEVEKWQKVKFLAKILKLVLQSWAFWRERKTRNLMEIRPKDDREWD